MKNEDRKENLIDQFVTHVVLSDGKAVVLENVPARVNTETGERLFSPDTVRKIENILQRKSKPKRIVETPVYEV